MEKEKKSRTSRIKWTYEACYNLAKECKSRTELSKRNVRAYKISLDRGWIENYTWFKRKEVKWTYEKCRELALKFKTLKEFRENYSSAENISRVKGWLKDFDWLSRTETPYTDKRDNVYAYIFVEFNSVYIGRTLYPKNRDNVHRKDEKSQVFKFASNNNISIPQMTILEKGLSLIDGLKMEDYYCSKYRKEGWNVLNVAKTGIGHGSIGKIGSKWSRKKCFNEAKKYDTTADFYKNNRAAYEKASREGWLKDYTWLRKNTKVVLQYSLEGKLLKAYRCVSDAAKDNNLSKSGLKYGINKTNYYSGYLWCHEGEESKIIEKVKSIIFKYDAKFNLVGTFITINKASSRYGKGVSCPQSIQNHIDTGKLASDGHYYYHGSHKFTDDEQNKNQDPDNNI